MENLFEWIGDLAEDGVELAEDIVERAEDRLEEFLDDMF